MVFKLFLLVMVFAAMAFSVLAVPPIISYQGRLTDSAGNPLDGTYSMTFRICDSPSGGSVLWDEIQSIAVTDGFYSVLLGSVDPGSDGIDESVVADNLYLEVQVEAEILIPRHRLVAVPYAIRVMTVDSAQGGNIVGALRIGTNLTVNGNTGLGTASPTEKLELNGVMKFTTDGSTISKAPRVIRTEDTAPGCPGMRPANTDLILQNITLARSASIYTTASMIRTISGRADLALYVDGVQKTITIAHTPVIEWQGATVVWTGILGPGNHSISVRSPQANAWGCGGLWGAINTTVFEQ